MDDQYKALTDKMAWLETYLKSLCDASGKNRKLGTNLSHYDDDITKCTHAEADVILGKLGCSLLYQITSKSFIENEDGNYISLPHPIADDAKDEMILLFFEEGLKNSPKAQKYIKDVRKHSDDIIKKYRLGAIGGEYNIKELRLQLDDDQYLIQRGLLKQDINNKCYVPLYRSGKHIVLPVFTEDMKLSHFTFKPVKPAAKGITQFMTPKISWVVQTPFYPSPISNDFDGDLIVVEGQDDALTTIDTLGVTTIATIGSLSADQAEVIASYAKSGRLYLAFDNDAAGHGYVRKVLALIPSADLEKGRATVHILSDYSGHNDIDDLLQAIGHVDWEVFKKRFRTIHPREVLSTTDVSNSEFDGENDIKAVYALTKKVHVPDTSKRDIAESYVCLATEIVTEEKAVMYIGVGPSKVSRDGNVTAGTRTNYIIMNAGIHISKIVKMSKWDINKSIDVVEYSIEITLANDDPLKFEISAEEFSSNSKLKKIFNAIPGLVYSEKDLHLIRQFAMSRQDLVVIDKTTPLGWNCDNTYYRFTNATVFIDTRKIEYDTNTIVRTMISDQKILVKVESEQREELLNKLFTVGLKIHNPSKVLLMLSITVLGWFRNRLFEIFHKRPWYAIIGSTGSGKTTVARLGNSLDGVPFAHDTFSSTMNAVQRNSSLVRDSILIIDDYKSEIIDSTKSAQISALIQSSYDGKSRDRMNDSGALEVNAAIVITGENSVKKMASVAGRVFEIIMESYTKTGATQELFEEVSEIMKSLSAVKPILLAYFNKKFNEIILRTKSMVKVLQSKMEHTSNSDRIIYASAELIVVSEMLLEFAGGKEILSKDIVTDLKNKTTAIVNDLCNKQIAEIQELSIATVYVDTLKQLLASSKWTTIHAGSKHMSNTHRDEVLGYHDDTYCYLLPEVSVTAVKSKVTEKSLNITTKALKQALTDEGYVPEGKAIRKSFNGVQQGVWRFDRSIIMMSSEEANKEVVSSWNTPESLAELYTEFENEISN